MGRPFRTGGPDRDLIGLANGGSAFSVNLDDGDLNYDSRISHMISAISEIGARWRNLGTFVRAPHAEATAQELRRLGADLTLRWGLTLVQLAEEVLFPYHQPDMTEHRLDNTLSLFRQEVLAPARLSGGILLVHDTVDQSREPRQAWTYNPGQRRVRRAPNVAFDNPGTASDGMRTTDQFEMFNGSPERYDWRLVGKKELYVPYNSYRLHSDWIKVSDILKPLHICGPCVVMRFAICWSAP